MGRRRSTTFFSENGVYDKLGLKLEDEKDAKLREEACHRSGPSSVS
jgi:hypothetical protein